MQTTITQLRKSDWIKLENDVRSRIVALRDLTNALEPNPVSDRIANDLILPCITMLAEFVNAVQIEDEPTPEQEAIQDPPA